MGFQVVHILHKLIIGFIDRYCRVLSSTTVRDTVLRHVIQRLLQVFKTLRDGKVAFGHFRAGKHTADKFCGLGLVVNSLGVKANQN